MHPDAPHADSNGRRACLQAFDRQSTKGEIGQSEQQFMSFAKYRPAERMGSRSEGEIALSRMLCSKVGIKDFEREYIV
jgi:hypothetical protein